MKLFLIFTAQSLICEQTPEHITVPCVQAGPDYIKEQCQTVAWTELQPGLIEVQCEPVVAEAPSLTTEQQQLLMTSINDYKE
jgi:hypothetical protein